MLDTLINREQLLTSFHELAGEEIVYCRYFSFDDSVWFATKSHKLLVLTYDVDAIFDDSLDDARMICLPYARVLDALISDSRLDTLRASLISLGLVDAQTLNRKMKAYQENQKRAADTQQRERDLKKLRDLIAIYGTDPDNPTISTPL